MWDLGFVSAGYPRKQFSHQKLVAGVSPWAGQCCSRWCGLLGPQSSYLAFWPSDIKGNHNIQEIPRISNMYWMILRYSETFSMTYRHTILDRHQVPGACGMCASLPPWKAMSRRLTSQDVNYKIYQQGPSRIYESKCWSISKRSQQGQSWASTLMLSLERRPTDRVVPLPFCQDRTPLMSVALNGACAPGVENSLVYESKCAYESTLSKSLAPKKQWFTTGSNMFFWWMTGYKLRLCLWNPIS